MTVKQNTSELLAHIGNIERSEINRNADYDLEEWIQSCVRLAPGDKVLDVGCGSGTQVEAFSSIVGVDGHVTGIDMFDKLPVLRAAAEQNLAGRKNITLTDHDASDPLLLTDASFDLIASAYSIYYVEDVSNDINLPPHARSELWNLVSRLEELKGSL